MNSHTADTAAFCQRSFRLCRKLRIRSGGFSAMQRISPNQPFDIADPAGFQTALSLLSVFYNRDADKTDIRSLTLADAAILRDCGMSVAALQIKSQFRSFNPAP
jgi:hypothetical protein